jgi:hypothetical protein
MPMNALFAGLLHIAFPKGKIIYCRRNVYDNCLSLYVTPYDQPNSALHSAANIAILWNKHVELSEHWQSVLPPESLLMVDYEHLVSNHEAVVRQMIDFVGVRWDGACLKHESNKGAISTPSQWQARQAIYSSSVERWRRYEPWVEELRSFL